MNWSEIAGLLHIVHNARELPTLKPIHDAAMKALEHHASEGLKQVAEEAERVKAKAEAEVKAKAPKPTHPPIFPRPPSVEGVDQPAPEVTVERRV